MLKVVPLDPNRSQDPVREALETVLKALDSGHPIRKVVVITEVDGGKGNSDYECAVSDLTVKDTLWLLEMGKQWLFAMAKE